MSAHRLAKVQAAIKQATSEVILHELNDPRLGFVTVTKVETSRDLKHAKVHISVMGGPAVAKRTLAGLKHARRYIQSAVSNKIRLRYTPGISFHLDESVKKNIEIAKILGKLQQERHY